MQRTLIKHGDGLALVLDAELIQQWQVDANTPIEVEFDGETVTLQAIRDGAEDAEFKQALGKTNKKYASALKRLAE